jgi:hypothetical protein
VTPKTVKKVLKKKVGRPSDGKTTLAVLRSAIEVPAQRGRYLKRTGRYEIEAEKLPVKTVSSWLNVKEDSIRCIERGRPGYPLTAENAEKIAHQTGASVDWLLANEVSKPIINSLGEPFTQKDFEDRQKAILNPSPDTDLRHSRGTLASCCAKIAAILVRGAERGQPDEYAYKLNMALRSVYFDRGEKLDWPTRFSPAYGNLAIERPDFTPLFHVFEKELRSIHRKMEKPCPACMGQGVVACKNCIKPVGVVEGKTIEEIVMNKKTGLPVDCKVCKNARIVKCHKCGGSGRVASPEKQAIAPKIEPIEQGHEKHFPKQWLKFKAEAEMEMIKIVFFHRTTAKNAKKILSGGFRDTTGKYMTDAELTGVWVSREVHDEGDTTRASVVLAIQLKIAADKLDYYEVKEDGKPYREWCIPASILNKGKISEHREGDSLKKMNPIGQSNQTS